MSRPGEVALVTAGDPDRVTGGNLYDRRMVAALRQAGLATVEVVLPEPDGPSAPSNLQAALARQRPALVVVDSIALAAAAPIAPWVRASLRAPLVALMHMLPSDLAPPGATRRSAEVDAASTGAGRRPAVRALEARLLREADRVVAVSPSLGEALVAAGAAPDRVVVIPPGRDGVPTVTPPSPAAKGDGGLGPDVTFLCVANWSPAKGIHHLVEALAQLDVDVRLDLVGEEGDDRYARRVRTLISGASTELAPRRHGLSERVRVHGPLQGEALARRYAGADAFVLPSRSEGFGIVYAEAMSFGLPVVACRIGSLPWLVEDGCGVLVAPDDAGALAEAMRALAADPALRGRMGEAARRRALRLPTWAESAEQFRGLVRELLEAGAPAAGPADEQAGRRQI